MKRFPLPNGKPWYSPEGFLDLPPGGRGARICDILTLVGGGLAALIGGALLQEWYQAITLYQENRLAQLLGYSAMELDMMAFGGGALLLVGLIGIVKGLVGCITQCEDTEPKLVEPLKDY